jgi:hypothetical protein
MDRSREWGQLWARMLAVQIYERRRAGLPLSYCIGAGWHISHTESVRCTAEQLAARPHFVARWSRSFPELKGKAVFDDGKVALFAEQIVKPQ